MSTHPQSCESCVIFHELKKKETPCSGCEHEPPISLKRNQWFLDLYNAGSLFRTGQDSLDFSAFMEYLKLNELSPDERLEMIDKAVLIEGINRKKQNEEYDNQKKEADRKRRLAATTTNSQTTLGGG